MSQLNQKPFFETEYFLVEAHPKPFITRTDGGHIRIRIKDESIPDRTKLQPKQAIELMRLTMLIGEAMETGLKQRGIPILKINYEELGNWAYKPGGGHPFLHVHVFGRSEDAKFQPFPDAVSLPDRSSGFYDNFEPLNDEDISAILEKIHELENDDRYLKSNWGLE